MTSYGSPERVRWVREGCECVGRECTVEIAHSAEQKEAAELQLCSAEGAVRCNAVGSASRTPQQSCDGAEQYDGAIAVRRALSCQRWKRQAKRTAQCNPVEPAQVQLCMLFTVVATPAKPAPQLMAAHCTNHTVHTMRAQHDAAAFKTLSADEHSVCSDLEGMQESVCLDLCGVVGTYSGNASELTISDLPRLCRLH